MVSAIVQVIALVRKVTQVSVVEINLLLRKFSCMHDNVIYSKRLDLCFLEPVEWK